MATLHPLRVLILVKGLGLGGAERLIVDQVRSGEGGDAAYSVAYVNPIKTHFVPALEQAGVTVHALRPAGVRWPWPIVLARLLAQTRPDVVHSHSPLPAAVARVLVGCRVAGSVCRHVYTEHNRWSAYRVPTRVVNALTMVIDRLIWAVSSEARDSVWPASLRARVTSLHHGIDVAAVRAAATSEPAAPAPTRQDGAFVFIHIANRRPEKAHDVLLQAFALAAAAEPTLALWLVGQGLDTPEFGELVGASPVRDRIEVLGYRRDAPSLLARADGLVLSSDHEGLPVAVMEAFALGKPIVSTDVGGMPEAVDHGVEGLLVPRRDPEALADAMVNLARDPVGYAAMAASAAERAAEFDAVRSVEVITAGYRSIAAPEP